VKNVSKFIVRGYMVYRVTHFLILVYNLFDAVILDYNLPDRNGLEVGKEIVVINSNQRIIFVSGYVKDALSRTMNELNMPVETNQILIDIVEETEIYDELKKFKIDVSAFKNAGFRHESLRKMLNVLGERKTDEDEDGKIE
jgi:two-component SAPR family response regulator